MAEVAGLDPMSVAAALEGAYPEAECELDFASRWQLLVATILSAQTTDGRVNSVTPGLFERWPGAAELAAADSRDLEDAIRPIGMFRNKARSLRAMARVVATQYGGQVPESLEGLLRLPGVGPKTAKVVLGIGFGMPVGIAVDTHVRRVAHRLGLSSAADPEEIARDLERRLPEIQWVAFSSRMILHGRRVCHARNPACDGCVLRQLCPRVGL